MRSQWTRRVIPRWRSSAVSSSLLENFPSQTVNIPVQTNEKLIFDNLKLQVEEWSNDPSLGVAADLLNFSHVTNLRPLLTEPAKFVINHEHEISPQLNSLAQKILGNSSYVENGTSAYYQQEIIQLKNQLRQNPRNSIALIDIARLYAIQGQAEHAERAIRTAVALQPNHRFILRSATRFYLHDSEPDEALSILKKSPRTQEDPWLMASMIAVETIMGKSPLFYKRAKAMLENGRFSPLHIAELGASLATIQANSGLIKNAKQLFNASLINPNDNAVAQAVWAANEFSIPINIDPGWLIDRFSSEANYYAQEKTGDYNSALTASIRWFQDEPFSTRPLQAGAFAASIIGDYRLAEDQMRRAIKLDATDIETKNNLIFALCGQNKLEEASKLLTTVFFEEQRGDKGFSGHTLANLGMYFYRIGDPETGRNLYNKAYLLLDSKKENASKVLAMCYFVQEAKLANDPEYEAILKRAKGIIDNSNSTAAKIVLARTTGEVFFTPKSDNIIRSSVIWKHDKLENILIISKKEAFGQKIK